MSRRRNKEGGRKREGMGLDRMEVKVECYALHVQTYRQTGQSTYFSRVAPLHTL